MPFHPPDDTFQGKDDAHNGPESIAIVGLSFQFPGGCDTTEAFWQTLVERRNTATEAPTDRYSAESLWHPDTSRRGTVGFRGGHFLTRDIAKFDAPFFSISDTEAAALDPQQRGLLETTFRALENAGQVLDQVAGSNTSVFTGCFTDDWELLSMKDSEQCASHTGVGIEASMLANRLSWFFDFKGTSCNLDSACSSGLLAVDLACKSLASGDSDMSIAAGCNLLLYPDIIHPLSNLGLLSPDSLSYPFDARANGYGRGDGFGVLVLKRVSDAIANNDVIRAVIRATGSNQDGRTSTITQPSGEAQADLIRSTYARAGLSLGVTRFVEAHGTGTQTGDPIEADAIGKTFRPYRSADEPLFVGALKSNIGHLEGASGIAGVIKTVLVLERGIIPPNANFDTLNPKIDVNYLRIKLPEEPTKWPSKGPRRASVNSFGFGGSNSHVVIDDAHHYLRARGLKGNHNTLVDPETPDHDYVHVGANGFSLSDEQPLPKLVVLSANDETTLQTQVTTHSEFFHDFPAGSLPHVELLQDLAYTLNERRHAFSWRSAAVIDSPNELEILKTRFSAPVKSTDDPAACFVFTGQGAQYPGDRLRCLEQFKIFRSRLEEAQECLMDLGCQWKIRDELYKEKSLSNIDRAEFSQPLSTIIQIALVDLLRSFGIFPSAVVGHSSGEIAAAYCTGVLCARSAIKVAYFRGYHTAILAASKGHLGGMMAVALSAQEVLSYINKSSFETGAPKLTIACINSPKSVTISGDCHQLDLLETRLSEKSVFVRRLNVDMAYHSPAMQALAEPYYDSIGTLVKGTAPPHVVTMLSTVTGKWVRDETLRTPQYWVDNLISPVQFSPAVERLNFQASRKVWKRLDCSHRNHPRATFMLEVGFHGALRGPLQDILGAVPGGAKIGYETILVRNQPPFKTLLGSIGQLFCHGYAVDLRALNTGGNAVSRAPKLLCNLPEYQFNHSKAYWEESRIAQRFRLHPQKKLDLLGKPSADWNKAEAKWRNFIRVAEMPWVEDHKINGTTIYPGAGMLVMAIEAANQLAIAGREIEGFELKDIQFLSTLAIPRTSNGIETHLYLRESRSASSYETPWSEFRLFCYDKEQWTENCCGSIRVQYKTTIDTVGEYNFTDKEKVEEVKICRAREVSISDPTGHEFDHAKMYACLRKSGFDFGSSFQLLRNGVFVSGQAKADVILYEWPIDAFPQTHIVHPCSLDAMLHLSVATFAEGGRTIVPTAIPSALRKLWISKDGLSSAKAKSVRTSVWMTRADSRGTEYNISALDASGSKVLVRGEGLQSTIIANVSASSTASRNDENQVCYHLNWKPDAAFMTKKQLATYCAHARPHDPEPRQYCEDLAFVLIAFLTRAMEELSNADLSKISTQHLRYMDWATDQLSKFQHGLLPGTSLMWLELIRDEDNLAKKCNAVAEIGELGPTFVETGVQLSKILRGEVTPPKGLFKAPPQGIKFPQHLWPILTCYLDILNHKSRRLKLLEISSEEDSRMLSSLEFAEYTNVEFKAFIMNKDATIQGFKQGCYDVVCVTNVTRTIACEVDVALRNIRNLLRTGGSLILYEPTGPNALATNFISGLLPGRELGFPLDSAMWTKALRRNGFHGIDLEIPDFLAPECHQNSIMIARAANIINGVNGANGEAKVPRPIIVMDLSSDFQKDICVRLQSIVSEDYRMMDLSQASHVANKAETSFIFIEELENHKLMYLSEPEYKGLQSVLTTCKASLWVTNGGGLISQTPTTGVADGLFRVLRNERPDSPHATLGLDVGTAITDDQVGLIHKVFQEIVKLRDPSTHDQEYVEVNGVLHIPRVMEAKDNTENIFQGTLVQRTISQPIQTCPPIQLAVDSTGFLDSIHFIEDDIFNQPLESDEVEIEVRAAGLNFRDVLVALGRISSPVYGSEASGIVTRVGSPSLEVSPGDRVVMIGPGMMRTFARSKAHRVLKIEEKMSFPEAASISTQFCTAWQTVHELAHLQAHESILIHTGAGGTGQAAIQVAQYIGATIYATVGSDAKRKLLIEEYRIPESHIFYSRNTSFAKGVMRMTGNGVDVVLNSLSGDSLIASWECIAPYGRFVELGKKDILQNSNLPMYMFRQNASFICFDAFKFAEDRPKEYRKLFEKVVGMFKEGVLTPAKPLHVFPISKVEDAFRAMQDGKLAGKIVLEMAEDTEINATLRTKPSFTIDENSTYLIAGGFGGLGRNVARWLADRGARNLLLLSRSGPRKESAQALMKELAARGVVARAPVCDVTDFEAVKKVIDECAQEMPPIKGCVQASMVLRDFTFDKMTYANWRLGTDCKTIGSWNLHKLLPIDLNFFILISSASGVVGLHGQANYAAGNAYMDALARYRISLGLRATSLDLGALTDDGLLAEDPEFLSRVLSYGALNGISRTYFNAIMDYYCNPSLPPQTCTQSQPIVGLCTGDDGIITSRQPIFRKLATKATSATASSSPKNQDWKAIFAEPAKHDIADLITTALIRKLAKTNSSLQGEIDVCKPLVTYGVDSLLAVELRSWLAKEFGADVALLEIQGGVGFESLGRIVAGRSVFNKDVED
ncbi:reducing type I polyketide synthase [Melanomma pulvis-pyrius CBS 109.77]|uniref:Reducing type I polyketide synthase n=1 Tax=Melanomma pulvis-pyrius CBS 109.77 TaxID=1314802 RepID=A0A6A6XR27_9PLEO|nr:reducing type I polyketide synthase [Melanomma pulvis-pyrius CBS 109.77]